MIYPNDAITSIIDTTGIAGTSCGTFIATSTSPKTLLYGQILTDNNAYSEIRIGSSVYLRARADRYNPDTFAPVVFSNAAVVCTRPGGADTLAKIVYINRDFNATSTSSSTLNVQQGIVNGFTYGEIINSFLVFVLVVLAAYNFLYHWVKGYNVNTK